MAEITEKDNETRAGMKEQELNKRQKEILTALQTNHQRIADVENQVTQLKINLGAKIGDVSRAMHPPLNNITKELKAIKEKQSSVQKQTRNDISSLRKELETALQTVETTQQRSTQSLRTTVTAGFAIIIALLLLGLIV